MNGLRKTLALLGVPRKEVSEEIDFDVAAPDEYVNNEGLVYLIAWNAGGDSIAVQAQIGKTPNGVRWVIRGSVGGSPDTFGAGVADSRKTVQKGIEIAREFLIKATSRMGKTDEGLWVGRNPGDLLSSGSSGDAA